MAVITLNNLQANRYNNELANRKIQVRVITNAHRVLGNPKANTRAKKKAQRLIDAIAATSDFVGEQLKGISELAPSSRPEICNIVLNAVRKFKIPTRGLHGMLSDQLAYRMF